MKRKKGLPTYPGSRSLYVSLSVLIIFEALSIVAQAVFLARTLTFLFTGAAITTVVKDMVLFLVAFLFRHGLAHLQQLASERFAKHTVQNLRKQLVDAYFQLGQRFVQTNGTGRLVTLAIEGMEQLQTYLEITVPRMLRTFIIPSMIVLYIFTEDIASAVILIVTVPIIIIFMILLGLAAKKRADKQYDTYRVLSNHFIDTLKGLETLKYLGKSRQHEGKIGTVSRQYRKATMRTLQIAFLSSFALNFFTSLSIAFVAVSLGLRLIDGSIVLLPALTILILAPEYFLPIKQVGADYHATLDGQIAMQQMDEIIEQKEKIAVSYSDSPIKWQPSSILKVKKLTAFHDQADTPVLKDIDFSWKGNGLIGIVGESGAGKSTLIDVLAGFLPLESGEITIDNIKTNSLARKDWQQHIAYIPQHPYIFPTSIANNIRFYEPTASDEKVEKVVDEIGLRSLVSKLPNGIHEEIGEGGRMLSGGQEQRIAMARALLSKRPIILLDEPTAHLDIETEYEVKQTMLHLFKNKLVFLATHRLHWMREMDYILVLQHGHLVERGSHEALIAQDGRYRELVKTD